MEEEEKQITAQSDGIKDYLSGFKVASIEKKVINEKTGEKLNEELAEDDEDDDN